ncbi:lipoprotein insertase outer membrane protein LolB [Paraferrimonas sp. SM1919]|uniref:lipoprotein insertase outer membrane protein LolB n=1 Tax=Paraferrimonas sp. SM1919 TaxID=2662263 RepID=UPI0013D0A761|nr:lipoprotein insertase outer membrane protein LolB [Paraferrimonas sp. SM1919]
MQHLSYPKLLIISLMLFFASACSVLQHNQQFDPNDNWQLKGKLAIITPQQRSSVNIRWQQLESRQQLDFSSFLGINVLTMEANKDGAKLAFDGKEYHGQSSSELIYRVTGWQLPLAELPLWVKGVPSETATNIIYTPEGQLQSFVQNSFGQTWLVNISKWQDLHGKKMPKLISIQHPQLKIKLQINQWQNL